MGKRHITFIIVFVIFLIFAMNNCRRLHEPTMPVPTNTPNQAQQAQTAIALLPTETRTYITEQTLTAAATATYQTQQTQTIIALFTATPTLTPAMGNQLIEEDGMDPIYGKYKYATFSYTNNLLTQGDDYALNTTTSQYVHMDSSVVAYDSSNRESQLTKYTNQSPLTGNTLTEVEVDTYSYNSSNDISVKTVYSPPGTEAGYYNYTYNASGKLTEMDEYAYPSAIEVGYGIITYDSSNRMSQETVYMLYGPTMAMTEISYVNISSFDSSNRPLEMDFYMNEAPSAVPASFTELAYYTISYGSNNEPSQVPIYGNISGTMTYAGYAQFIYQAGTSNFDLMQALEGISPMFDFSLTNSTP
jgi:hypothetical protein